MDNVRQLLALIRETVVTMAASLRHLINDLPWMIQAWAVRQEIKPHLPHRTWTPVDLPEFVCLSCMTEWPCDEIVRIMERLESENH